MIAAHLMTTAVDTLRPGSALSEALELFVERRAGLIPVVDEDGRLAGVLTPESIIAVLAGRPGSAGGESGATGLSWPTGRIDALANGRVEEAMEAVCATVSPDANIADIARMFAGNGPVNGVLVVDDCKRLLGVISPGDVLRIVWESAERKDR